MDIDEGRRLAREYPRTAASIAIANLAPLIGVLGFGWSIGLVLVLYWFESGVVLLCTLLAALIAGRPSDTSEDTLLFHGLVESDRRLELGQEGPRVWVRNLPVVGTMSLFFGLFWFIHGVFVLVFAAILSGPDGLGGGWWLGPALLSVVVGQGEEFYAEQIVDRRYRETSAKDHISGILGRTLVLHATLLIGGMLVFGVLTVFPQGGLALLAVFVALKGPYEFGIRVREREESAETGQSAVDG